MNYSSYYPNHQTIKHILKQYSLSEKPWILGYSGGKDSSALLKLVFIALYHSPSKHIPITVLYCNTGVEIPVVHRLANNTLNNLVDEAQKYNIPLNVKIVSPELKQRYFVKVIGRGYPPPSNKFRWCTDRLRINPIQNYLSSIHETDSTILLGIRHGESVKRDKTINKYRTKEEYYFHQSNTKSLIYSPIVNYSTNEIWRTLILNIKPESIDVSSLFSLYQNAGGECPIIRDINGPPCSKGRFGCWTCTVVSRDRAVEGLVEEGRSELLPLLEFRNWLATIRDNPSHRCLKRRNGSTGLGPFTLTARQEILDKLCEAQNKSGIILISDDELEHIYRLWEEDRKSPSYIEV